MVSVKVLETKDEWFGVTYAEDKGTLIDNFKELVENNVYSASLYGDLYYVFFI